MSSCSCECHKNSENDISKSEDLNLEFDDSDLIDNLPIFNMKFEEDVLNSYPEINNCINDLKKYIEKQEKRLKKLRKKLQERQEILNRKNNIEKVDVSTQTEKIERSLVEDITEAATNAVQESGFVYEASSGLYYDYNTGYYYNSEYGLYYDGNNGTYYKYNEETKTFDFYSKVSLPEVGEASEICSKRKDKDISREERKRLKTDDVTNEENVTSKRNSPKSDIVEEGECSDTSSDDDHDGENKLTDCFEQEGFYDVDFDANRQEIANAWPPCMRVIVQESKLEKLREGTLFVITCDGGTLGREGEHAILIPDINVSKHHATFNFDRDLNHYTIVDLGSRNGTLLNGKRLSVAKQESLPTEITHDSVIQISTTKLLCHIHLGNETCEQCEPGVRQKVYVSKPKLKISKSSRDQYRIELKRLKDKFGIDAVKEITLPEGYSDRAKHRRDTVGSSDPNAKTEMASVDKTISSENKGFRLLKGMGWTEGQSLGKDGTGITEPVPLVSNTDQRGLGCHISIPSKNLESHSKKKTDLWQKMNERYRNIPTTSEIPVTDLAEAEEQNTNV